MRKIEDRLWRRGMMLVAKLNFTDLLRGKAGADAVFPWPPSFDRLNHTKDPAAQNRITLNARGVSLQTQLRRQDRLRLGGFTTFQYGRRLSNAALSSPLSGKKLKQSVKFLLEIDACYNRGPI
jgi:hypothetical protein